MFFVPIYSLRNNRQTSISLKNSKKNLIIIPIVKDGNISLGRISLWKDLHTYIHNNGDHILIQFFFGHILVFDIQENLKIS